MKFKNRIKKLEKKIIKSRIKKHILVLDDEHPTKDQAIQDYKSKNDTNENDTFLFVSIVSAERGKNE